VFVEDFLHGQLGELFQVVAATNDTVSGNEDGLVGRAAAGFSKAGLVETYSAMRGS
jgi:hypothetical protein